MTTVQGWRQSNSSGFGSASNTMISALAVFDGQMYATTSNESSAQVWRTSDGESWTQFTPPAPFTTTDIYVARSFGNHLYIGTYKDSGDEIWRTEGTNWERIATDGVNDTNNLTLSAFAVFSDTLYAATGNLTTGIEIFRSSTGDEGSWSQVNSDGFGGGGTWDAVVMDAYDGPFTSGLDACSRGPAAWLSPGARTADYFDKATATFRDSLYIGTGNDTSGGQIWQMLRQTCIPLVLK